MLPTSPVGVSVASREAWALFRPDCVAKNIPGPILTRAKSHSRSQVDQCPPLHPVPEGQATPIQFKSDGIH